MKKTKFAYLFATTLVAGTMGLTSCQEEVENPVAKEGSVTIGLSTVATRSTADEVNMGMGTTLQQIDNVVVVPMIGDAYQNPILFGNFTPTADAKVKKQTRTMSQAVTRFKVFGNVCDGYVTPATLSEAAVFTGLTFTAPTWESGAPADGTYSKPHELYYYYDTNTTGFSASKTAWDTTEPTDWATGVKLLGDNKSVKITPVNYAVGVLAAAIQNGDVTTDFYTNEACSEGKSKFDENKITVSGITIAGQTQSFNADFTPSETVVNVYETAVKGAKVEATKVTNDSRATGDIYSVVAPTTAGTVTLNIEFTVASGVYFKLADGQTIVGNGQKLYLPVVLNKDLATSTGSATNIFEADKATFLNAKVMNWGLASETPVKTTDVTIGVEFDVDWAEGLSFDVEI